MKNYLLLLSIIGVLAGGCVDRDKVPSKYIARDSMRNILWDLMQADQYALQYLTKDSARINVRKETMNLYEKVFQIHGVTRQGFKESYDFYLSRPDISAKLFDSLSARANKERAEIYKPKPVQTNHGQAVPPLPHPILPKTVLPKSTPPKVQVK